MRLPVPWKLAFLSPTSWPTSVKIPIVVAVLMIGVSTIITNVVLARLSSTQEQHLKELTDAYLDGLSTAVLPLVLRQDVWEVYDVLDRSAGLYQGLSVSWTTVTGEGGLVLASSRPAEFPSQSELSDELRSHFRTNKSVSIDTGLGLAYVQRELTYQGQPIGAIYARVDISGLLQVRASVLMTLVLINAGLTLFFAVLGYITVRRMLRPIGVLSRHLVNSRKGPIEAIPDHDLGHERSEFGLLFRRYNALVEVLRERELLDNKLAEEEKLASLGRLASGIAHEINNPLGGMLNAVDALKRHGERESVRATSTRLIEQGLYGIRDLVRSTLMAYRSDRRVVDLSRQDFDDLRLLVQSEMKRKSLTCAWRNDIVDPVAVPAGAVRDAVLNLLLNACQASPEGGTINVFATADTQTLTVHIEDQGNGMPERLKQYLASPEAGRAPVDGRGGLGLWMVKRLIEDTGGTVEASDRPGGGCRVSLRVSVRREEVRHVA